MILKRIVQKRMVATGLLGWARLLAGRIFK
jgi:hypothetical protein